MLSAETIRAMDENPALTVALFPLTNNIQTQWDMWEHFSKEARSGAQLYELWNDAATARERYMMMKTIVAAVVDGTGTGTDRYDAASP